MESKSLHRIGYQGGISSIGLWFMNRNLFLTQQFPMDGALVGCWAENFAEVHDKLELTHPE